MIGICLGGSVAGRISSDHRRSACILLTGWQSDFEVEALELRGLGEEVLIVSLFVEERSV